MSFGIKAIVAAEDEETDRIILSFAFERAKLQHKLVLVRDGRECLDYLSGVAPYDNRAIYPLPALLLLDLKMPVMDGFEVLAWLASRPDLQHIPALVLSSSSADSDIQRAGELGARDYFVKPLALQDLIQILLEVQAKWLGGSTIADRSESEEIPAARDHFGSCGG